MGRSENLDHDGPSFLRPELPPMMGRNEMWTKLVHIFIPGTSDQVDPKLKIRAMMARIIWPGRRQKREPSWLTFHRGPLLKKCAKLELFFESTLLETWDNFSYISEGTPTTEIPDNLSGIIRWTQINFPPIWQEVQSSSRELTSRQLGAKLWEADHRVGSFVTERR